MLQLRAFATHTKQERGMNKDYRNYLQIRLARRNTRQSAIIYSFTSCRVGVRISGAFCQHRDKIIYQLANNEVVDVLHGMSSSLLV